MKLHPKQIIRSYERAYKAKRKTEKNFLLTLLLLIAVVSVSFLFTDPANAGTCFSVFAGSGLASMMIIGDISDIADKNATGKALFYEIYLIDISEQIDRTQAFPTPNAAREVGTIPMLNGQYMKKFSCHSNPQYSATGEKGDAVATGSNSLEIVMAGARAQLQDFAEQHIGKKFIAIFREVDSTSWLILGSVDRPLEFKKFDIKNNNDGRYVTYTFERESILQYYTYTGSLVTQAAGAHTAGQTTLAITAGQDVYTIPNGASATYAINALSGITASDKGRIITLYGAGTNYSPTIADGSAFVLEDGTTWTGKAGSKLVLKVIDSSTLCEVVGSRIQTS